MLGDGSKAWGTLQSFKHKTEWMNYEKNGAGALQPAECKMIGGVDCMVDGHDLTYYSHIIRNSIVLQGFEVFIFSMDLELF